MNCEKVPGAKKKFRVAKLSLSLAQRGLVLSSIACDMDASILAKFPNDEHVLGPFLGNLPPEILDEVVKRLGWFQVTFELVGKTCRESVDRARVVPSEEWLDLVDNVGDRVSRRELDLLENMHDADSKRYMPFVAWRRSTYVLFTAALMDTEAMEWLLKLFEKRIGLYRGASVLPQRIFPLNARKLRKAAQIGRDPERYEALLSVSMQREFGWESRDFETVLRWAQVNGWERDSMDLVRLNLWATLVHAARRGHHEVLKWAQLNHWTWDWADVGREGRLDVIKSLHEIGYEPNSATIAAASKEGRLEVLKWLSEIGYKIRDFAEAAEGGHLEVLKWLRDNGCEWDSKENLPSYLQDIWSYCIPIIII